MKQYLFAICTLFFTTSLLAQNVNIPDAIFKNYLVTNTAINTNGDGEISVAEAEAFTGKIFVIDKGILDLTGIETFVKIISLTCGVNNLTTLDVSKNTALTELRCYNNKLTSLDVSKNTALTDLYCGNNKLTSLDVTKNIKLTYLLCYENSLTTLDISKNTALTELWCSTNKLKTLDISKNINLTYLQCDQNTLTTLDISKNKDLVELHCRSNNLTTLDVSKNTSLNYLDCFDNQLSTLDVSLNKALKKLGCSNNQLITLHVSKNSDLYYLYCSNNQLSTLDVSNNPALASLDCHTNNLVTLNVSNTPSLASLDCYSNKLVTLEVSTLLALAYLDCNNNQLISFDVSKNTVLTNLVCESNKLTTLDLSKNIALKDLKCGFNTLPSLDLSKNIGLTFLSCHNNKLSSLNVSKNTALTKLYCSSNKLTSLDLSKNVALTTVDCSSNALTSLDLRYGNNTAITLFSAIWNPNLFCISVDDAAWANENWTNIDTQTTFNTNCFDNYFQAIFTADTLFGEVPLPVSFTDQSSGKPTTWQWSFGDGTTGAAEHNEHTFSKPGDYTVSLRVTKDADTSYYSQIITATPRATVREKINPFAGKGRSGAVSFVIDTVAYVGLGRDADSCFTDMWQFNPLNDTWTEVAPFPGKARSGAVAFVINDKAYVGLGDSSKGWDVTLYNDFYEYNPEDNTWKQVAGFGGTARNNAVAFALGDTAYVGTGASTDGSTSDFWKYTPSTNQWTEITGFTGKKRTSAVAFVIEGKGYVSGGDDITENGTTIMSDVQEYNPNTGQWKEKVFADGINLSFNSATAIGEGKTAFICYGNKKKVVRYTPQTNDVEDLGDILNLQDERYYGVSFYLHGAAYFGLGVTYGDFSENYAAHYKNDIQHIDLPFVFAPEDILLSNDTLVENSEFGTVIGTFSTVDKTEVDTFTYEITEGFNMFIEKDSLKAVGGDYEIDSVHHITVKTTDMDGFTFEKAFTIKVKDINEAPWKLEIVGDTVLSGAPLGTLVGNFKAYDDDTNDSHIFKFDATRSDADTVFYSIIGDSLIVANSINKDDLAHYFYVLAIDKGGLELSSEIFIDIIEGVGIRMVESAETLFDIYPNPVGDFVTVQSKKGDAKITELVLLNAMGKVVSKTEVINATNYSLQTAGMKPGIYFLMVRTKQGSYIQKIIKE